MATRRTYLQWVSAADYPSAEDFVKEVRACGVSRRLPTARTAAAFAKYRPAIFLVHGGQRTQCLACAESVICPECGGRGDQTCSRCKGLGAIEQGTGGHALVDGQRWTYKHYMSLKRVTKSKFWKTEHVISDVTHCQTCGGRGWLSRTGIFGIFLPDRVEHLLKFRERRKHREWLASQNIRTIDRSALALEKTRANGERVPGGYYAVTLPPQNGHNDPVLIGLVDDLVDMGAIETGSVEIVGSFAWLRVPIPRVAKQFRGLKRFDIEKGEAFRVLEESP